MNNTFYKSLLNSIKDPILFADTNHIVQYMNKAAIEHFEDGKKLLQSNLLDCHNEESQRMMIEILVEMQNGFEEKLITDNEKYRIFMRSVRDEDGNLLGYFERYEPPQKM
ncbi:MAG: PAS domain-containing protein [Planctomycetia bacterium]|nr:PAS domain-containing protein [Planctomycetia bacterium]